MAVVTDGRKRYKSYKSAPNRQRFIDRNKAKIKKQIDDIINESSIKDAGKKRYVRISDTEEYSVTTDPSQGIRKRVYAGNDRYLTGDKVPKQQGGQGNGKSGHGGKGSEDEFIFQLTTKEFWDLYFGDLELPNYVKETLLKHKTFKHERAGYSKVGTPSKIDLKKTMENAIARRISTRAKGKTPRFLDEIDIRYRNYEPKPKTKKKAVIFFIMDVSASMGEREKAIAKKFYILLYIFLKKQYDDVDIVFIKHTHNATECTEHEFFYGKETGGTAIYPAFELMNQIRKERYKEESWNIFVAQASDGDAMKDDADRAIALLYEEILPAIQFMFYTEVYNGWPGGTATLVEYYEAYLKAENYRAAHIHDEDDVLSEFRKMFKKEKT